jgi:Mg/Co/Ni transporter MgtE
MKTTIQRVKRIQFTEQEQEILKELNILDDKELILNDIDSQQIINILIEVNPDKQEHKDFIMEFIKELKR